MEIELHKKMYVAWYYYQNTPRKQAYPATQVGLTKAKKAFGALERKGNLKPEILKLALRDYKQNLELEAKQYLAEIQAIAKAKISK